MLIFLISSEASKCEIYKHLLRKQKTNERSN